MSYPEMINSIIGKAPNHKAAKEKSLAKKMSTSTVSPGERDRKIAIKYLTNLKNLETDEDVDPEDFMDEIENYAEAVIENLSLEDMKEIRQYPNFEKEVDEITGDRLDIHQYIEHTYADVLKQLKSNKIKYPPLIRAVIKAIKSL